KKMIVPVAIGLVLGLGGSVAAGLIMGKEPVTLEQSLGDAMAHAGSDSAAVQGTPVDSLAAAHADSAAHAVADSVSPAVAAAVAETTHVTGHPGALAFAANAAAAAPDGQNAAPATTDSGLPE